MERHCDRRGADNGILEMKIERQAAQMTCPTSNALVCVSNAIGIRMPVSREADHF